MAKHRQARDGCKWFALERGCVVLDQPQRVETGETVRLFRRLLGAKLLRLVEDDTAALR